MIQKQLKNYEGVKRVEAVRHKPVASDRLQESRDTGSTYQTAMNALDKAM